MMLSHQRVGDVLGEQVMRVGERVPGYRKDLAEALKDVLVAQSDGYSERGRRSRVRKIVDTLGIKLMDQLEDE